MNADKGDENAKENRDLLIFKIYLCNLGSSVKGVSSAHLEYENKKQIIPDQDRRDGHDGRDGKHRASNFGDNNDNIDDIRDSN